MKPPIEVSYSDLQDLVFNLADYVKTANPKEVEQEWIDEMEVLLSKMRIKLVHASHKESVNGQ